MRKKWVIAALAFVLVLGLTSWWGWTQAQQKGTITEVDKAVAKSQLGTAKESLEKAKGRLQIAEEKCCLKPEVDGCNMCVLMLGDCSCREWLLAGKAVCPECGLLWLKGKGLAPDKIKLSQVKTLLDVEREKQGVKLEE
ncbi:hypothetical protein HYR99_27425 [Candidatus Poribacteria bacterium]|nr:hypothetical protein [Candidatus Poribacteria bacterium]